MKSLTCGLTLASLLFLANCGDSSPFGSKTKLELVETHIPNRLLQPCLVTEENAPETMRQFLVKLAKTEKALDCANGKIVSISEIVSPAET